VKSAIYRGVVRHRRYEPVAHAFTYRVAQLWLDLDEMDTVFAGRWLWSAGRRNVISFRNEDHLDGSAAPLAPRVRDLVERRTGRRPAGPVRLLTYPRYFGYVFNPVSFFYCFDESGARVETVVAEVNNTPWGERHHYVLDPSRDEGGSPSHRWRFAKQFHVSPFHGMDSQYDWRFVDPADQLVVHMDCLREGRVFFDSTMTLDRREISGASLASAFASHPFMTGKVIAAIHWQALRLWMKRAPFHPHPVAA
jgi:DUF1365 family protein